MIIRKHFFRMFFCLVLFTITMGFVSVHGKERVQININGDKIEFTNGAPFIDQNNRTLIPVRDLCERINARVQWDESSKQVRISQEDKTILLTINQKKVRLNDEEMILDTEAVIKENRTYVPLRFLSEALDCQVEWKGSEKTAYIKVEPLFHHYRGQLHSHTSVSDGNGTLDEAYRWAKEKSGLDFFAVTDHSNLFDNDDPATLNYHESRAWKATKDTADFFNENGKFIALAGYELTYIDKVSGHMNTFNTEGFYSRHSIELDQYYEELEKNLDSISQFNHPGTTFGDFKDFDFYSKDRDAVIHLLEVGNGPGNQVNNNYWRCDAYYTKALDKGWHVAPTNGQDNHQKNWGTSNPFRTVVLAKELTREDLFDAIRKQRVYSSEDSNIEVNYSINGFIMGSEITDNKEMLNFYVGISDPDLSDEVYDITVISNGGKIVDYKVVNGKDINYRMSLKQREKSAYYYVRIRQKDNDYIFTAPIWVK